jgi:acyl dehydratase
MTMTDYSYLEGHRFAGGTYTLGPHMAWLWADTVLDEPNPDLAHPSLGYVLAMRGCVSITELFDLLGTDAEAGVMFGECELTFERPLSVGATYDLEGEILSIERKEGRRSGPFDRLRFQVRIREHVGGQLVCTNTNTWMIPREGEA